MRKPWFCIVDEPGPRKPWFRIIDVTEAKGRSMADIAIEVAEQRQFSIGEIRGDFRQKKHLVDVRNQIFEQIHIERPDLSSGTVGAFLRCDPSTVRRHWREMPQRVNS